MALDDLARIFLILLATIDPIGTLSVFVGLTATVTEVERRRIAVRSVLIGGSVLLAFLVIGQVLLQWLGIGLGAFQLSGGIVLFLFGLQMVFGAGAAAGEAQREAGHDLAVFPLAIPSIAGPGSILAIVVLTDNDRYSIGEQALTACTLVLVLAVTLALLLLAGRIHRVIGTAGASTLIRIMGLILCALAMELFLEALATESALRVAVGA